MQGNSEDKSGNTAIDQANISTRGNIANTASLKNEPHDEATNYYFRDAVSQCNSVAVLLYYSIAVLQCCSIVEYCSAGLLWVFWLSAA